jgi:dienelactone hydrolase
MKPNTFTLKREKIIRKLTCFIVILFLSAISPQAVAERVEFKGSDTTSSGDPLILFADLYQPAGDGPFPAVIMMHGCAGDNRFLDPWEKRILNWGYVVLRVDSISPRLRGSFCSSDHLVTAKLRAQDAYDAKSYLSQLPFVDKDNVALIGWSHGGTAILYAIDDKIPFEKRGNPFKAAVAFYPYCTNPLGKQNAPLLVLIGEKDDICKATICRIALVSDKPPNEIILKEYKNAHHCFDWKINTIWHGHKLEYNQEAAEDAISQTQKFLSKYFK